MSKRDYVKGLNDAIAAASKRYNEERDRSMACRAGGDFDSADHADCRAAAISSVECDLRTLLRNAER